MDMQLFQKIIDEISDWPGWISIYLNNGGEPLLDRIFKERIEYCYKKGMSEKIIMQTNAEFLTEEYARILLDAGVGYIFPAFDGATKETYEKHRVNCHFENVLNNISGIYIFWITFSSGCFVVLYFYCWLRCRYLFVEISMGHRKTKNI